jgi:carbon-monoxide dehydrogenase small subunit
MQQAFWDSHGLQCGFCTPGMMLTSVAFLKNNPHPSEARDSRRALRQSCAAAPDTNNIVKAVQQAAAELAAEPVAEPVAVS